MDFINFFPLPNPSNIYGLARLDGERNRILVATLEKQIFCIEYSDSKMLCNEIHFAYIPNDADIISIDAFARSPSNNDLVVGITFFKNNKDPDLNDTRKNVGFVGNKSSTSSERSQPLNHYYFNIYSSSERFASSTNRLDLNQLAQDCQTFELDFVPYHLYHTKIINEEKCPENIWLLSGSSVAVFREDKKQHTCFIKEKIDVNFPELTSFKSIVLWIDILNMGSMKERRRLTAVGCEDGSVELFLVEFGDILKPDDSIKLEDPLKPKIIKSWKNHFDGPVISVRFFQDYCSELLDAKMDKCWKEEIDTAQDLVVNLLVVNSFQNPIVFRNVNTDGLLFHKLLPTGGKTDIFITSFIDDFNFDGFNEILLGTYGKEMITYKFDSERKEYTIEDCKELQNPLQSLAYLDLTGDGINELVVVTSKGVAIYRHSMDHIIKTLSEKINKVLSS